jgi:glycosyltransferase involved in cell wall biosynthesis
MKVTLVHSNSWDVGGSDTALYQMARAMGEAGFDLQVVLSKASPMADRYRALGADVRVVPMPRLSRSKNPIVGCLWLLRVLIATVRLAVLLRSSKSEFVFANDYNELPALWAARWNSIPRLVVLRFFFDAPGFIRRNYIGLLARSSSVVVCVSHEVRRFNFAGISADLQRNAVVLYDWCDGAPGSHSPGASGPSTADPAAWPFALYQIPVGARVIFMPSRIERWKGQHVLVDAAARVASEVSDAYFLIVGTVVTGRGREAYFEQLQKQIRELRIEDRVRFGAYTPNVHDLMRRAEVVVHCSVTPEPFGMTIVEGFRSGVPVVASAAGGPLEIVGETQAALLHTPGDADDLSRQLLRMLREPACRRHVIAEATRRANDFTRAARWPLYERVIRSLTAGSVDAALSAGMRATLHDIDPDRCPDDTANRREAREEAHSFHSAAL